MIFMTAIILTIPLFIKQISRKWYLISEIVLVGTYHIYLSSEWVQSPFQFALIVFIIGMSSDRNLYLWTAFPCIFIIPAINGLIVGESIQSILLYFFLNHAAVFIMGYAFQILMQSHKLIKKIEDQNRVLEQHLKKIEELTLIEERNRLSHELHDTIGHTLTSLVIGMESLRTSATPHQIDRIETLINLSRNGLTDIRKHLLTLTTTEHHRYLGESLQKLSQEFSASTGIEISFRLIGHELPIMKQVTFCMYRCLQESLTNAARHGQATLIRIQLHFERQNIRLQVEDNGNGIADLQFGFGLSGMRDRLNECSGSLNVHSGLYEGTVVVCTVPLRTAITQEDIQLLLVDDQVLITDSLEHILEQHPNFYVVGKAADGLCALESCEQQLPDIVLMDVRMPEMSGLEVLSEMKKRWPNLKVILLTTFEDTAQAIEAMQLGADGYMLKSIHPREMVEAIKQISCGGTWIDQSVVAQVINKLNHQRVKTFKKVNEQGDLQYGITRREMEVLKHLNDGLRYKSIAAKLFLSEGTIRNYCSALYTKLGVSNKEEAIKKARLDQLIT